MITVYLNDTPYQLPELELEPKLELQPKTLSDWLIDLGLNTQQGMAIAINDTVVPKSIWANRTLIDQDRVLIIQATQGG